MTENQRNWIQRCVLWFQQRIFGYRANSTSDSNKRRAMSRFALMVCAYLVAEAILYDTSVGRLAPSVAPAWATVVFSIAYFVVTVAGVLRLAGLKFRANPHLFILDTVTSLTLNVLAFSLLYRFLNITESVSGAQAVTALDHIYFSAVTFSTLGFGDFSPTPGARPLAALQAIMGNLHLGLIVGATLVAAQIGRSVENDADDDD